MIAQNRREHRAGQRGRCLIRESSVGVEGGQRALVRIGQLARAQRAATEIEVVAQHAWGRHSQSLAEPHAVRVIDGYRRRSGLLQRDRELPAVEQAAGVGHLHRHRVVAWCLAGRRPVQRRAGQRHAGRARNQRERERVARIRIGRSQRPAERRPDRQNHVELRRQLRRLIGVHHRDVERDRRRVARGVGDFGRERIASELRRSRGPVDQRGRRQHGAGGRGNQRVGERVVDVAVAGHQQLLEAAAQQNGPVGNRREQRPAIGDRDLHRIAAGKCAVIGRHPQYIDAGCGERGRGGGGIGIGKVHAGRSGIHAPGQRQRRRRIGQSVIGHDGAEGGRCGQRNRLRRAGIDYRRGVARADCGQHRDLHRTAAGERAVIGGQAQHVDVGCAEAGGGRRCMRIAETHIARAGGDTLLQDATGGLQRSPGRTHRLGSCRRR